MDLNNKNIGKVGSKIRKIGLLSNYFTTMIDKNQEIKRLLSYNTLNPLSSKGKGYDGTIKSQPDITHSLENDLIFDGLYDDSIKDSENNNIFIYVQDGKYKGAVGSLIVVVSILVFQPYNKLSSDAKRNAEIAHRIENLFDNVWVEDKDYVDDLGNLKPELMSYNYGRLSNTSKSTLTTMVFKVDTTTMKVMKDA
ncbi:MAG: hypothetical protein ACRDD7_06195 [Peptostreptococcaceae bacterium]